MFAVFFALLYLSELAWRYLTPPTKFIQVRDFNLTTTATATEDAYPRTYKAIYVIPPATLARNFDSVFNSSAEELQEWHRIVSLQNKCHINWTRSVDHQLHSWIQNGKISFTQVHELCTKRKHALRIHYVNSELRVSRFHTVSAETDRLLSGLWFIYLACARAQQRGAPIPAFEINMAAGDSSFALQPNFWNNAGPILSNIKCGTLDASVSMPLTFVDQFGDFKSATKRKRRNYTGMSLLMYRNRYENAIEVETAHPSWKEKTNKVFFSAWRGATDRGNRSHLYKISSSIFNISSKSIDVNHFGRYQYNIYAYGHCGWSRRIHELAFMNTVVFMEDSLCREYFHDQFLPGTEYVPVAEDFSDLEAQARRAFKEPEIGARMAQRWQEKGSQMMQLQCVLDYVETLLRRYAQLQDFEPKYNSSWPEYGIHSRSEIFHDAAGLRDHSTCIEPNFERHRQVHRC